MKAGESGCVLGLLSDLLARAASHAPIENEEVTGPDHAGMPRWDRPLGSGDSRADPVIELFSNAPPALLDILSSDKDSPALDTLFTVYNPQTKTIPSVSSSIGNKKGESALAEDTTSGLARVQQLTALVTVLQRPHEPYKMLFAFEAFITRLDELDLLNHLVGGLEQSWNAWKAQRSVDPVVQEQLLLLYAEGLFHTMNHVVQLLSDPESFLFDTRPDPSPFSLDVPLLERIYGVLCDTALGQESFQRRVALLLVSVFCMISRPFTVKGTTRSIAGDLLHQLENRMVQHFTSHASNTSLVSNFVVLGLLQNASLKSGEAVADNILRMWQDLFPVLSQGTMYDPDFSCLVEHDGTRSPLLQTIKHVLGGTAGRVWQQIHGVSWWASFSYQSLHSVARGVHLFAYTWSNCVPVGIIRLTDYVYGQITEICEKMVEKCAKTDAADDNAVPPLSSAQRDAMMLLTLYAYLCTVPSRNATVHGSLDLLSLQLRRENEEEQHRVELTPRQMAGLSALFPMPLNASKYHSLPLLPQYVQHIKMLMLSPHLSHITAHSPYDQASTAYFHAATTLLCSLLSSATEEQEVQHLCAACETDLPALLLSLFNAYSRVEAPDISIIAELFTCVERYYGMVARPLSSSRTLLDPLFLESVDQNPAFLSLAIMEAHLYASLCLQEGGQGPSFPAKRLLESLGGLRLGLLSQNANGITFFLTVLRYVYQTMLDGQLVLAPVAMQNTSPRLIEVLMEGAAVLLHRVENGYFFGPEGATEQALCVTFRLVATLLNGVSGAYNRLMAITVPCISETESLSTTGMPAIALLLKVLFSSYFACSTHLVASELWCSCLHKSQHSDETFHAVRLSLRSSSRSQLAEGVTYILRREIGQPQNVMRLEALAATQQYDRRLFMRLVQPQEVHGGTAGEHPRDLHDLRIVKVLCEIISSKSAAMQEKSVALRLIRGMGLTDAVQTSTVTKLMHEGTSSSESPFLGAALAASAVQYINAVFLQRRAEDQKDLSTPPVTGWTQAPRGGATPRSSLPADRQPSLPSISLPATAPSPYVDLLVNALDSGVEQLQHVHQSCRDLFEGIRYSSDTSATTVGSANNIGASETRDVRQVGRCSAQVNVRFPLVLGPTYSFSGTDNDRAFNMAASVLHSTTELCGALEHTLLLYLREMYDTEAGAVGKARELLQVVLECLERMGNMGAPPLLCHVQKCVAGCLRFAATLANVEEERRATGKTPPISPALAAALRTLTLRFLSPNMHAFPLVNDTVAILRPFAGNKFFTTWSEGSFLIEHAITMLAERMVRAVINRSPEGIPRAYEDAETAAHCDRFFEECRLFVMLQSVNCPSAALQRMCSSLVCAVEQLAAFVDVPGQPDVWTDRMVLRLDFLRTLLIAHPQSQGYIDKKSIAALCVALGQLPMPTTALPAVNSTSLRYCPSSTHIIWCAVLELLGCILSCGGRDGVFTAVKTGWLDVLPPIVLTQRFQYALSCFSGRASETALFVWDVLECHLCTHIVTMMSALSGFLEAVSPCVLSGFQQVHSSQFVRSWSASVLGNTEVEGAERDKMQWYIRQVARDQLFTLILQPSFFLPIHYYDTAESAANGSNEQPKPHLSFSTLTKFIVRQLRSVQRSSTNYLSGGAAGLGDAVGGNAAAPPGSRSPSVDTAISWAESDDQTYRTGSGDTTKTWALEMNSKASFPLGVETVELALAVFVRGAQEVATHVKQQPHMKRGTPLENELRFAGDRLVFTLRNIEKGLEGSCAVLIPFVKGRRRQIQSILASMQSLF